MEEDLRNRCEVSCHKRRRSPNGAVEARAAQQHKISPECSFNDDHDDEGFVYHGNVHQETIEEVETKSSKQHQQEQQQKDLDPVQFVNSFRHQIERSMQLIEHEVRMIPQHVFTAPISFLPPKQQSMYDLRSPPIAKHCEILTRRLFFAAQVALLDTLERGGSNPLTPSNVQAVQSLLMERIAIASKLQSELAQHAAKR